MILELTRQDVIALTNESKRKAILVDWQDWAGLSVYRLDLPDGRCTACMTGQRCKWNGGCRG